MRGASAWLDPRGSVTPAHMTLPRWEEDPGLPGDQPGPDLVEASRPLTDLSPEGRGEDGLPGINQALLTLLASCAEPFLQALGLRTIRYADSRQHGASGPGGDAGR